MTDNLITATNAEDRQMTKEEEAGWKKTGSFFSNVFFWPVSSSLLVCLSSALVLVLHSFIPDKDISVKMLKCFFLFMTVFFCCVCFPHSLPLVLSHQSFTFSLFVNVEVFGVTYFWLSDITFWNCMHVMTFSITSLSLSCLLYTSPSPRDMYKSRMPSSA